MYFSEENRVFSTICFIREKNYMFYQPNWPFFVVLFVPLNLMTSYSSPYSSYRRETYSVWYYLMIDGSIILPLTASWVVLTVDSDMFDCALSYLASLIVIWFVWASQSCCNVYQNGNKLFEAWQYFRLTMINQYVI